MRPARRRVRWICGRPTYPGRVLARRQPPVRADRASLLLGTALATTFLIGSVIAPSPAHAAFDCLVGPPPAPASPGPISDLGINDSVICVNTEARTNAAGNAIELSTVNADHYISLDNSGLLTASNAGDASGIFTQTSSSGSFIEIMNSGDVIAATTDFGGAYGIYAGTQAVDSAIEIENHGDITVTRDGPLASGRGISAYAPQSAISITNSGEVLVTTNGSSSTGYGLSAYTDATGAPIGIGNAGGITVTTSGNYARGYGIYAFARRSAIGITNSGDINITTSDVEALAYGMSAATSGNAAPISIDNAGTLTVTTIGQEADAFGVLANTSYSAIGIANAGNVVVTTTGDGAHVYGLYAYTFGSSAPLSIDNVGDITVSTSGQPVNFFGTYIDANAFGIRARARRSAIEIDNAGAIVVTTTGDSARGYGIVASTDEGSAPIGINNIGDITVTTRGSEAHAYGIHAYAVRSPIGIINAGDIRVTAAGRAFAYGISARTSAGDSSIGVQNTGDVSVDGGFGFVFGILAVANGATEISNGGSVAVKGGDDNFIGASGITGDSYSTISIVNSDKLVATVGHGNYARARGIEGRSYAGTAEIINGGNIVAAAGDGFTAVADGINITSRTGSIVVSNSGDLTLTVGTGDRSFANGIVASTIEGASSIAIANDGAIDATANGFRSFARGIFAVASPGQDGASIKIQNGGDIAVNAPKAYAFGIAARSYGATTPLEVHNSGAIAATAKVNAFAIYGSTAGAGSAVTIVNAGDVTANGENAAGLRAQAQDGAITISNSGSASATGANSYGILARNFGVGTITIDNSGKAFGGTSAGIYAFSNGGTTIVNSGHVSGQSLLAIHTAGSGNATIFNTGTVTGFVLLDADDTFVNEAGGVFEARQTSDFDATGPGGNDLFRNEAGGKVHTADNPGASEVTAFVNLDRFENAGLISLQDGAPGDTFTISNTPGGSGLSFAASGNSTLAVDAFLGGLGSASDAFIIEGNVRGKTTVQVNNTNVGPGVFNPSGVRVVTVTGATPNPDAFHMDPVDTGFFDYDLFFTPTGSGFWEFRSFPGGGAYLLPQLVTAAQDIWHQSSSTWFDRTADLRVLLAGGPALAAYDPGGKSLEAAGPYPLTPAVWARGSGSWLDRDDSDRTSAYGRNYSFDLDRDLETIDFQVGMDFGKRDFWSQGDALVFGLLGGFVHGNLDYDALARNFDFDGGQFGAYATYLNGGLFVDTLLNVHLYEMETATLGFPGSLDANTVGLRTDTGYRFGSFSGGPFLEPLATLEVMWADIDGFSLGGNGVSFDDDANVRGRLGLRAGTTMNAWEGTLMEPFVIGSLWGNLSDDNQATLVSTGTTFRFQDQLEDVWGEVSAGVNFFNFSQTTAVFAKVDVSFGDDLTGVGGKAGLRVNW